MKYRISFLSFVLFLISMMTPGQDRGTLTSDDYVRAASMLNDNVSKLIDNGAARTFWLEDNRLIYASLHERNVEYYLYNPADRKKIQSASMPGLIEKGAVSGHHGH